MMEASELFIEIGVEEVPVAELNPAAEYLSNSIRQLFASEHITFSDIKTWFTPRRLVLSIQGLSDKGEQTTTSYTGPRKEAAFDKEGKPTQAAIGFARSKGVDVESLHIVKLDKGEFVQVEIKKPGFSTKSLIRERLGSIILSIPFRKSMRWGDGKKGSKGSHDTRGSGEEAQVIRFIRPIRWLVVLYHGAVLPVSIGSVKASSYTYGLRTSNRKKIKITGSDSWLKAMKTEKIQPEFAQRILDIRTMADSLAHEAGGRAMIDDYLHNAITNLVESPAAILGRFDKRFMNMPEEVIMSVMETHQKYIPVRNDQGGLMPYFIGTSNNPYGNKALIRKGYERVLNARLEDAEFYYREDIKQPLEFYVELLKGMTFYPGLGSLYDKTQRIINIASFLCDEVKVDEALKIATLQAAKLCKADLATRLVSEFPELQGVIGQYYAGKNNTSTPLVAYAIAEQYSKGVPATSSGKIVSVADKVDTLVGFFSIGEVPTGTQDPYGLRRAAISILVTLAPIVPSGVPLPTPDLHVSIKQLIDTGISQYQHITNKDDLRNAILQFLYTRLDGILTEKYVLQQVEAITTGNEHYVKDSTNIKKLIVAVLATEPDYIFEADHRINALKDIVFKPDFEPLFLAFKRIINISKNHTGAAVKPDLFVEPTEKALYDKYLTVHAEVQTSLATRDYIGYIQALEKLVPEINAFFDKVLVMSEDEDIKTNRLNLLAKIKNLVMQVLDITKLT